MPVKPAHTYLNFTRKERRGSLVLLFIAGLLCSVPFIFPLIAKKNMLQPTSIDSSLAKLQSQKTAGNIKERAFYEEDKRPYDHPSSRYNNQPEKSKGQLFYFDPNTVSEEGWKKLGLRDKTIATILNYRNKGGKFKQPEDIKKIWGLFPDEAERLMPFVNIAASNGGPSYNDHPTDAKNYSNNFSEIKKYDNKRTY
ncbi:MAG: helix-hairpin-helix domain-containing protein, partial [Sphingobacteriales bacterium]